MLNFFLVFLRFASKTFPDHIFCVRLFPTYIIYTLRVIFNKENTAIWHTHVHVCLSLCMICVHEKLIFLYSKIIFSLFWPNTRFYEKRFEWKTNNFYSNLMVPLCVYFCRPPSFSLSCTRKERKNSYAFV